MVEGRCLIRLPVIDCLEEEVTLDPANRPALQAWQARPGQIYTAVDPLQACYRIRLTVWDDEAIRCVPFEKCRQGMESPATIEVYQSLPDKERFELILQKLTELGVDRIVPIETSRSQTQAERDTVQKKSHRWPDVVLKAALQCRRASLPELMATMSFAEALDLVSQAELKLMLFEGDAPWCLAEELARARCQSVALMIGPEGGFSEDEVSDAQQHGVLPVSLGPRILRTETAAIVATALTQNILGDLR
jgi:16S rRNA (uracil1498-N3)-methyltransferase